MKTKQILSAAALAILALALVVMAGCKSSGMAVTSRGQLLKINIKAPMDLPEAGEDNLDVIVSNPPFHEGGTEDQELGIVFLRQAASTLREHGSAWFVANRHLPYEKPLADFFSSVKLVAERDGFKVFEAKK